MYTKKGMYGIEPILPVLQEGWRTMGPKGTRAIANLLEKLSPYQGKRRGRIRTRALRRLVGRSAVFLVASDLDAGHHGHPVGLVRLEVHRSDGVRYGELHDLVVAEEHRGRDIGKGLVGKAIRMASAFTLPYVDLMVKPYRKPAKHMFASLGFREISSADRSAPGSESRYRFEVPENRRRNVS
jgi:ribosomal protein S18 acetylase RimI-like enzyme